VATTLLFEMTITRTDFARLLPEALGGSPVAEAEGAFRHADENRTWRIDLEPLVALSLGSIRLERHLVRWTFSGYGEAEVEALLERFERTFRRGGG